MFALNNVRFIIYLNIYQQLHNKSHHTKDSFEFKNVSEMSQFLTTTQYFLLDIGALYMNILKEFTKNWDEILLFLQTIT